MDKTILGIDISKKHFDVCLIHNDKEKYRKFANDSSGFAKLGMFLQKEGVGELHACMESTGRLYEQLAEHLAAQGHNVSVINPKAIKGFGQSEMQRTKTDKKDAGVIARFCQAHSPKLRLWQPHPVEIREPQEVMRYMDCLKTHVHQEERRLESGVTSDKVKTTAEKHIKELKSTIETLHEWLRQHVKQHERLRSHYELLKSIIGVGDMTAFTYLAEIGYSDRFKQTRKIESFCGIAPKQHQSGSSVRGKEHISKVGNSRMRKALYMPALAARDYNPVLRTFADRLEAAGKPPKVIICALMRKLLRIMYAVVSSETPFDPYHFPGPIEGMTFAEQD
ncbi:MAG TPA: IS110 family transposase [Candidatus Obscuribacterales bacterium]